MPGDAGHDVDLRIDIVYFGGDIRLYIAAARCMGIMPNKRIVQTLLLNRNC